MAITIIQYPSHPADTNFNIIMPVYNTIAFTVNSTNKAQCSFKYICDVYVNTIFIKRLKLFPSGTNGYATFKVERVLEDIISYDLHHNLYGSTLFAKNDNSIKFYNLKFGEEYDSSAQCTAGTTIYPDLLTSDSVVSFMTFNGALQKRQWLLWRDTNYQANISTAKFLTGFPESALIQVGDQMTFNIFNANVLKLRVRTYNQSGTLIATYTYTNSFTNTAVSNQMLLTVGVGPENLNNSTLLSGTQPVISSAVYSYTVQLLGTFDVAVSEIKTITIDKRDVKWTPHRLWWLGKLGNFDSYTYSLKDQNDTDISRTEFTKIFGELTYLSPGNTWTYGMEDRGRTTLNVNAQDKRTYISNWLTELEALWMKELFTSVECYLATTNPKVCFDSIVISGGEADLNIGEDAELFEAGDIIRVFIVGDSNPSFNAQFEILEVGSGSITIADPTGGASSGTILVSGYVLAVGFVSELEPLIITSTSWDEKTKNKIKNINYNINVDDAHAVNTQRN